MTTATAPHKSALGVSTDRAPLGRTPRLLNRYPSASRPGQFNDVTLDADGVVRCTCLGFRTHGHCWNADKEIAKLAPLPLCVVCHLNPVTDLSTCAMCAADPCHGRQLGLTAAKAAPAPIRELVRECLLCGTAIAHGAMCDDCAPAKPAAPRCPGYLREHPAVDGVIVHWCAACDPEAPAAVRLAA